MEYRTLLQKPAREQGRKRTAERSQSPGSDELFPDECIALADAQAPAIDVIVSHIGLPFEGEVPDYVHYHRVDFQMIYCLNGRMKVVYEDQGPPFWLRAGDCVLQPPEIRHRVLECTAGVEVIEISMPAEHETWGDHDIVLPTYEFRPDREFNGHRFVRFIARKA
jgi:mannose-6-phosphate isomerase-like protein (cupin superfamily)